MAIDCARLYSFLLPHRGRTGTGLLVSFRGGSLGGAIRSRKLRQKTRYPGSRSTIIPAGDAPDVAAPLLGAGLKNAFKLSEKLLSSPSVRKTSCCVPRGSLIERSVKKSLRLVQKLGARSSLLGTK